MAPPGVGETTIAETLSRVVAEDAVWIPYAIEVDGQIITVYVRRFTSALRKRSRRSGTSAGCCASARRFWPAAS